MATILFLTHRIPYPPNKGDKLRAYHVLDHWTKQHKVFLGCFIDAPEDLQYRDRLSERCAGTYFVRLHPGLATMRAFTGFLTQSALSVRYYHNEGLAAWVDRVMASEKPDCVFVYSSVMGQYVLGANPRPSRLLVDFVDVDSEKWAAYAEAKSFPLNSIYRREAKRLLQFDRKVAAEADANIFVSEAEAELFRERAPEVRDKIIAISNGIDANYFAPENAGTKPNFTGAPIIVFTGQMDYWPNVDAVVWFSKSVLPKIQDKFPDATFYIVGTNPSTAVQALRSRPGIIVTGRVPDVRPYVGHAHVVVAPLRIGRGIQNKVLEGMAMARPVIVTPQALEGIYAIPDTDLLLAHDADQFVEGVERSLSPSSAKAIGAAARQRVIEAYNWQNNLAKFDQLLR